MSAETGMSRRAMLVKIGLLLNGIVGVVWPCRSCAISFLP